MLTDQALARCPYTLHCVDQQGFLLSGAERVCAPEVKELARA
jgi:hypothetical protein